MSHIPHAFTLLPRQSRMINAMEGFRLEVCSGCLWLTRPGDAVDRFLVAGTTIDLHENHVLIQSDPHPGSSEMMSASYVLRPLAVPCVDRHRVVSTRPRLFPAVRHLADRIACYCLTGFGFPVAANKP